MADGQAERLQLADVVLEHRFDQVDAAGEVLGPHMWICPDQLEELAGPRASVGNRVEPVEMRADLGKVAFRQIVVLTEGDLGSTTIGPSSTR